MPDRIRDLLLYAEEQYEPSPEFVERLGHELTASTPTNPSSGSNRRLVAAWLGMSAAAVLVVLGIAVLTADNDPGAAASVSGSSPVADGSLSLSPIPDAGGGLSLSMAQACDSFLIEVGSMLRSGNGRAIAYPSSVGLSALTLYEMRDSLSRISELYQLDSEPSSPTTEILSIAIREFGQAALFVQLGEEGQAKHHVDRATAVLDDLSGAPGLRGCLEL